MGYAHIGCCQKCEIPVIAMDENGLQHTCKRCNNIWLNDDLLFLDWQTAKLNAKVLEEFDRTNTLTDATLDLINEIKNLVKETTNEYLTNDQRN